ncbi:MAG: rod shape-determining protein MreD [Firmicutes bacterium]|jgi:rod shape-determining protein MreD|nr:rod shape-determining protein MreD [Bacillota bacterium]
MGFSGKRLATVAGSMIGILLLQSTLLYNVRFFGARPDLVLAMVGSIALLRGWSEGLLWGVFGGLAQDFVTGSIPGSHALAKSIIGFTLGLLEGKVFRENAFLPSLALFIGALVEGIIFFLAAGVFGQIKWSFVFALRMAILPAAVATTIFAPLVYRLCNRIYDPPRFGSL